jgi:hypothetical protein
MYTSYAVNKWKSQQNHMGHEFRIFNIEEFV